MRWFVVLIAGAVAIAIGVLMLYLGPASVPVAHCDYKGCAGPPSPFTYEVPVGLMQAGMVGIVVGVAGTLWSRKSWRRLSVVSAACGALGALLLVPLAVPALSATGSYESIWLAGLLSLAAIGTAVAAFIRGMPNKLLDIPLAVLGMLAGLLGILPVGWIMLISVGGGMG